MRLVLVYAVVVTIVGSGLGYQAVTEHRRIVALERQLAAANHTTAGASEPAKVTESDLERRKRLTREARRDGDDLIYIMEHVNQPDPSTPGAAKSAR